jgi:phosphoribosylanthranilate isomerase
MLVGERLQPGDQCFREWQVIDPLLGVEQAPGIKSAERIHSFISEVRRV